MGTKHTRKQRLIKDFLYSCILTFYRYSFDFIKYYIKKKPYYPYEALSDGTRVYGTKEELLEHKQYKNPTFYLKILKFII